MIDQLPTGRRGQLLASGITVILLGVLWLGIVSPLVGWFQDRAESLARQRVLEQRMAMIAQTVPRLLAQAHAARPASPEHHFVIQAPNDAVAGAVLQQTVQALANKAGITLGSVETLPAAQLRAYRRIGLRVTISVTWPALVRLLQEVAQAEPRILVSDLQLDASPILSRPDGVPLAAEVTIVAFRAGTAS
jgi:general secretion pathway protein M